MDAKDVLDSLFRYFNAYRGYKYQLANAYVFKWESDFFCLASSGYSYEIEVKVSRSDYKADFNKERKHRILSCPGSKIALPNNWSHAKIVPSLDKWTYKEDGHYHYENKSLGRQARKKPPATKFEYTSLEGLCPNKFFFATPEALITPDEVPDYAGLIYTKDDRRYKPRIVKRPPALHKNKKDFTKILLKKYYWAYLNSLDRSDIGKNFDFPHENNKMVRTK